MDLGLVPTIFLHSAEYQSKGFVCQSFESPSHNASSGSPGSARILKKKSFLVSYVLSSPRMSRLCNPPVSPLRNYSPQCSYCLIPSQSLRVKEAPLWTQKCAHTKGKKKQKKESLVGTLSEWKGRVTIPYSTKGNSLWVQQCDRSLGNLQNTPAIVWGLGQDGTFAKYCCDFTYSKS